ncbi:MAG: DUF4249 family protein [Prevotella sp.]|nr:DUF4249 family protein [Prevotella sp.]
MKYFAFLLLLLFLISCDSKYDYASDATVIVVDGHIENDSVPLVSLSNSININSGNDDIINNRFITDADVFVSDGITTEKLKLYKDKSYTLNYIYKGTKIKGVCGKTYNLTINYKGKMLTSSTEIPKMVKLDSIQPCKTNQYSYYFNAYFDDIQSEPDYYMFLSKDEISSLFNPSYLSLYSDSLLIYPIKLPVFSEDGKPFSGSVDIKLAHINREAYLFWYQYMHNIKLSNSIFFQISKSPISNIFNGTGIWFGMATSQISYINKSF